MHKQCAGYFPGTGKITDVGHGKGRFYTLNFPLKDGVTDETYVYIFQKYVLLFFIYNYAKGRLISEGILTLVPLPTKGAKLLSWAESLNKLFTVMGWKFKFSTQEIDLAPFVAMGPKSKITFWY